jgi:hypothetical protein
MNPPHFSFTFFFNLHSGRVESKLGPLGTSATYLPRVIVKMENLVE